MIDLLIHYPLLLLFAVAAIGYPLGHIKFRGVSLGVAAVLFVGLAFGSLHPDLKIPDVIYQFGVVIFVYSIGLSSGPGFVAALRQRGLRDMLFIAGMLVLGFTLTVTLGLLIGLSTPMLAGLFAGSFTNTPTLASAIELISALAPADLREQMANQPVIAYSLAYPMGVIGMLLAIVLAQRIWKINYTDEQAALRTMGLAHGPLVNSTIRVTHPEATVEPVAALTQREKWDVLMGRVEHDGHVGVAHGTTRLQVGDLVSVIGSAEDVNRVTRYLGAPSEEHLEWDRHEFDYRRVFVSNPELVGQPLKNLHIPERFDALVTRVRRGDEDLLPHGDTVLELGDRVRVVAPREQMPQVSKFFGDSYRALSEIDIMTFSVGIALGLLLGLVPIPLPGGITLKLGHAGGPLVVALVLGALGRTGPINWGMPYSANLTLRQIGVVLLLAAVGTRAGYSFVSTLAQGSGLAIIAVGSIATCVVALLTLWIGYKLLKIPMSILTGMLAGLQTQPAVLGFALAQTKNDLPNVGYATVYPIATITKILLVQLVLLALA